MKISTLLLVPIVLISLPCISFGIDPTKDPDEEIAFRKFQREQWEERQATRVERHQRAIRRMERDMLIPPWQKKETKKIDAPVTLATEPRLSTIEKHIMFLTLMGVIALTITFLTRHRNSTPIPDDFGRGVSPPEKPRG